MAIPTGWTGRETKSRKEAEQNKLVDRLARRLTGMNLVWCCLGDRAVVRLAPEAGCLQIVLQFRNEM